MRIRKFLKGKPIPEVSLTLNKESEQHLLDYLNKMAEAYSSKPENYDLYKIIEDKLLNFVPQNKNGNKIHIKKKNRGKFTASAKAHGMSVLQYASHVLNDPNASATLKKRANFARNAAKWKH